MNHAPHDTAGEDLVPHSNQGSGEAKASFEKNDAVERHFRPNGPHPSIERGQVDEVGLDRTPLRRERVLIPLPVQRAGKRHRRFHHDQQVQVRGFRELAPRPRPESGDAEEVSPAKRGCPLDRGRAPAERCQVSRWGTNKRNSAGIGKP